MGDKIVYITGAGFSRPLGLPLMNDFYEKSKDLYINDSERFAYFNDVFNTIKRLHHIKSFYNSDLFNIEEILSILEMWQEAGQKEKKESINKYISDVIQSYTPETPEFPKGFPTHWYTGIVHDQNWRNYLFFVLSFFSNELSFHRNTTKIEINKMRENINSSIITLNYDLIIEKSLKFWGDNTFIELKNGDYSKLNEIQYCKLHGSIDREIIPPTWNKGIREHILNDWTKAHKILEEANYIVFIGYSLPESDSYIRYLLKSSVIDSINLKNISIINKELNGKLRSTFEDYIEFKNVNYYEATTEKYLSFFQENITYINSENENIRIMSPVDVHKKWIMDN